ncbi:hypothetical protein [uncultured Sphingomonas sp.]
MSNLTIMLFTISLVLLSTGLTVKWQERRADRDADPIVEAIDE